MQCLETITLVFEVHEWKWICMLGWGEAFVGRRWYGHLMEKISFDQSKNYFLTKRLIWALNLETIRTLCCMIGSQTSRTSILAVPNLDTRQKVFLMSYHCLSTWSWIYYMWRAVISIFMPSQAEEKWTAALYQQISICIILGWKTV